MATRQFSASAPVNSFVVRIYRSDDGATGILAGTVQGASLPSERMFSTSEELWQILSGTYNHPRDYTKA
jgi:hypothetical protein